MASRADASRGRHIIVRVAGPEDAEAIEAVLQASYPRLMALPIQPMSSLAPCWMVRASPALLRSGTYYLAATPDGTVVGCSSWAPSAPARRAQP